ncbi:hypothetical protein KKD62_00515 [Patescibacteria group bacterium]|nr:hypothetical protein [Patescibacteria group bacterium]MBU1931361.1 hypothetical protein [Patescibacteria group bacterium]
MKRLLIFITILLVVFSLGGLVQAQELESTNAAEATPTATVIVEEVVLPKEDITQPTEEVANKLVKYLEEKPIGALNAFNWLQHMVRWAVGQGIPANTLVLLLMFPLMAAIIAASRHLVGLRGLGIFIPAVLSVAFVATGIVVGIVVFLTILMVARISRRTLGKLKLQYLPRMALLLWFVTLGVLAILFVSPFLNLKPLINISIFPILILVLLAESFIEVQLGKSQKEASEMTVQTIMLSLVCSLLLNWEGLQKFVILNPELIIMTTAVFNFFVGRYTGLRLLERWKFKDLLK